MKIRGLVIAKDEIDVIPTAIERAGFCDDFISIDNGSTDGTYEYLKSHPKVTCVRDETPFSERHFAQSFCDLSSSDDVDWFVGMDADEFFTPQYDHLKEELAKLDPSINVVTVPMLYMFPFNKKDGKPTFDDDLYWRSRLILKRFYKNCPEINPDAEHLIGYHCGKIPIDVKNQKVHDLGFKWFVRHYQFRKYERAARKLESYLVNDNERNQGYEYMREVVKALKTEDYSAFNFRHVSEFLAEEEKMMAEARKWRENKKFQELGL